MQEMRQLLLLHQNCDKLPQPDFFHVVSCATEFFERLLEKNIWQVCDTSSQTSRIYGIIVVTVLNTLCAPVDMKVAAIPEKAGKRQCKMFD
jgi:hypothetical protein